MNCVGIDVFPIWSKKMLAVHFPLMLGRLFLVMPDQHGFFDTDWK